MDVTSTVLPPFSPILVKQQATTPPRKPLLGFITKQPPLPLSLNDMDYFIEDGRVIDPVLVKLNDEPDGYNKMMTILSFFAANTEVARMNIMKKAIAWVIIQNSGEHNMLSREARTAINHLLRDQCKLDDECLLNNNDVCVFMNHWEKLCIYFKEMSDEKLIEYLNA